MGNKSMYEISMHDLLLLLSLLSLIVEVEITEEITVLSARDDTDIITEELLLQELLSQILEITLGVVSL